MSNTSIQGLRGQILGTAPFLSSHRPKLIGLSSASAAKIDGNRTYDLDILLYKEVVNQTIGEVQHSTAKY